MGVENFTPLRDVALWTPGMGKSLSWPLTGTRNLITISRHIHKHTHMHCDMASPLGIVLDLNSSPPQLCMYSGVDKPCMGLYGTSEWGSHHVVFRKEKLVQERQMYLEEGCSQSVVNVSSRPKKYKCQSTIIWGQAFIRGHQFVLGKCYFPD